MKTVGLRELKNNLSAYVRAAREGETVTVTDRSETVAQLIPPAMPQEHEHPLAEMARRGEVRLGKPMTPKKKPNCTAGEVHRCFRASPHRNLSTHYARIRSRPVGKTLYAEPRAVASWLFREQRGIEVERILAAATHVVISDLTIVEFDRAVHRGIASGRVTQAAAGAMFPIRRDCGKLGHSNLAGEHR